MGLKFDRFNIFFENSFTLKSDQNGIEIILFKFLKINFKFR